jgi:hypothetical protein
MKTESFVGHPESPSQHGKIRLFHQSATGIAPIQGTWPRHLHAATGGTPVTPREMRLRADGPRRVSVSSRRSESWSWSDGGCDLCLTALPDRMDDRRTRRLHMSDLRSCAFQYQHLPLNQLRDRWLVAEELGFDGARVPRPG